MSAAKRPKVAWFEDPRNSTKFFALRQPSKTLNPRLMTVPPFTDESHEARPYFRELRELQSELQGKIAALGLRGSGDEAAFDRNVT